MGMWWLAAVVAIYYCWRWEGYELFLIGVLIDGYSGQFSAVPFYSLGSLSSIVAVNLLRPRFLL